MIKIKLLNRSINTERSLLLPGKRRIVPYSIQWLKRLRPALFRQDAITLIDLLQRLQIKPLVAHRLPIHRQGKLRSFWPRAA